MDGGRTPIARALSVKRCLGPGRGIAADDAHPSWSTHPRSGHSIMLHLRLREFMLALFVALAAPTTGAPADFQAGALRIGQPWSRATPKGAQVGAGYLTITNTGSEPDRLIGGSLTDAGRVEIHQDTIEGGVV